MNIEQKIKFSIIGLILLIITIVYTSELYQVYTTMIRDTLSKGVITNISVSVKGRTYCHIDFIDKNGGHFTIGYFAGYNKGDEFSVGDTLDVIYSESQPERAIYNIEPELNNKDKSILYFLPILLIAIMFFCYNLYEVYVK